MRLALCTILLVLSTPCLAGMIVGRASVIDGDTIKIRGQRIRLFGIDAPEGGRTCKDAGGRTYGAVSGPRRPSTTGSAETWCIATRRIPTAMAAW